MAQAKITVVGEDLASEVLKNVGAEVEKTGKKVADTSINFGHLKKALEDLAPETEHAAGGLVSMREAVEDAFTHPAETIKTLVMGLSADLAPALGGVGVAAGITVGAMVTVGTAAFELAERATAAGAHINDMTEKTGIAVPVISRWSNAAKVAGTDVDALSNAVFMMQKNMAESPDKFSKGLERINVDFEDFKRLSPDEQMLTLAEGFKAAEDPAVRTAAGVETIGRAARDMMPSLMKMGEAIELTSDLPIWTEEQAKQAEHLEMQIAAIKARMEQVGVAAGKELIPALQTMVEILPDLARDFAEGADHGLLFGAVAFGIAEQWRMAAAAVAYFTGEEDKLPTVTGEAKRGLDDHTKSVADYVAQSNLAIGVLKDEKDIESRLNEQYEKSHAENMKRQREAEAEAKKYADAWTDLNNAGDGWRRTLDGIDDETRAAAQYYVNAGASLGAVATAFGLTAVQAHALAEAHKDEIAGLKNLEEFEKAAYKRRLEIEKQFRKDLEDQTKETNRHVIAGLDAIVDAQREDTDTGMRLTMTATEYQIAKVEEWRDAQLRAFDGTAEQYGVFYDHIQSITQNKVALIVQATDPLARAWHDLNADMQTEWAATFEKAIDGQGSFVDALTSPWKQMQDRWKKVLAAMAADWESELLGKLGISFGGSGGGSSSGGGGATSLLGMLKGGGGGGTPGYSSTGGFNDNGDFVTTSEGSGGGGGKFGMGSTGYGVASMGTSAALSFIPDVDGDGPMSAGGGAIKGAKMGSIAGPYGAAIGAAIGAIVGMFKDHEAKDEMRTIGEDWGVTISGSLAMTMEKEIGSKYKTEMAAAIGHLGDIIDQAGGLKSSNLEMFTGKLHDTFSMIQTGQLSIAQGTEVLDKNWQAFVAAGTDADGRLSDSLKQIIQLNDKFGTDSKAIADYLQGQGAEALGGFHAVMKGALGPDTMKAWDDLRKKLVDANNEVGKETNGFTDWSHASKGAMDATKKAADELNAAGQAASGGLHDLGVQAIATFAAGVASGKSEKDMLAALHPDLQQLQHAYEDLGLNVDDVALSTLMMRDKITTAAPDEIAAVGGLKSEMVALDNMGLMNQQRFEAMERTGVTMFQKLSDKVHALGGTDEDVLSQMQSFLHQAQKEADLLHVPLDEATQSYIDQSKTMGIWKDEGQDATGKLTTAMGTLVDKVGDLIDRLNGVKKSVNDIPSKKTIEIDYTESNKPAGADSYANEGYDLTTPRLAMVGDNPFQSESVLHASTVKDIVRAARNASGVAGGDSGAWRAVSERIDALHDTMRQQTAAVLQALATQPFALRDAALVRGRS
jgi:hypothetical protein